VRLLEAASRIGLHSAASAGDAVQLRLLLKQGTNIDTFRDGNTALHCAADGGHLECVRTLVEAGADVGLPNARGETAFDLAGRQLFQGLERRTNALRIRALVYKPVIANQPAYEAPADPELEAALLISLRDLRIYGGESSSQRLDGEEESECVICLSAPVTSGLLHGDNLHAIACAECAPFLQGKPCPVCRARVERILVLKRL
jgi:hypothetical protein